MLTTNDVIPRGLTRIPPSLPYRDDPSDVEISLAIPLFQEGAYRLSLPRVDLTPRSRRENICRLMNVALASVALLVLSPVMLVFAALIRLTSPGPIFYSQPRVGFDRRRARRNGESYDRRTRDLGGRPFLIHKFRTMRINAEQPTGAVWATKGDPRVTAVGRVMRRYRVDELPQLVNVLRGDMSLVGSANAPNPALPVGPRSITATTLASTMFGPRCSTTWSTCVAKEPPRTSRSWRERFR
jgi:lipopolysaccharide/colanic/teichoic acid biosynthesis glycosyltransferase